MRKRGLPRVLVVDDEPRVLTSIEDLLEDEFEVLTSADPETALGLLERQEVSVILSDQRMPKLSGDEFLSRAREVSRATRVLITGYTDLEAVGRAVNFGRIYAYVAKPWELEDLRATVIEAFEHYRSQHILEGEQRWTGPVLLADDDPEDCALMREAWKAAGLTAGLSVVPDGELLMHYLHRHGPYANPDDSPRPDLILLDLNMPKKSGHEALREIKAHRELQHIPVVILSSSRDDKDVLDAYAVGASGFITKPETFDALVRMTKRLGRYWSATVVLPSQRTRGFNGASPIARLAC